MHNEMKTIDVGTRGTVALFVHGPMVGKFAVLNGGGGSTVEVFPDLREAMIRAGVPCTVNTMNERVIGMSVDAETGVPHRICTIMLRGILDCGCIQFDGQFKEQDRGMQLFEALPDDPRTRALLAACAYYTEAADRLSDAVRYYTVNMKVQKHDTHYARTPTTLFSALRVKRLKRLKERLAEARRRLAECPDTSPMALVNEAMQGLQMLDAEG